jgi:hypothetical protein
MFPGSSYPMAEPAPLIIAATVNLPTPPPMSTILRQYTSTNWNKRATLLGLILPRKPMLFKSQQSDAFLKQL